MAQQGEQSRNPNDRSWLVANQRVEFVRHGDQMSGKVEEVYPEPPYQDYVRVRLDDGENAYIPFARIAEGMRG